MAVETKYIVNGKMFSDIKEAEKYDQEIKRIKAEKERAEEEKKKSYYEIRDTYEKLMKMCQEYEQKYSETPIFQFDQFIEDIFETPLTRFFG